jgi:hypothetical protein
MIMMNLMKRGEERCGFDKSSQESKDDYNLNNIVLLDFA